MNNNIYVPTERPTVILGFIFFFFLVSDMDGRSTGIAGEN